MLAHAAANASSILLEQTGWLEPLYAELPGYLLLTAACLAVGAVCWGRAAGKSVQSKRPQHLLKFRFDLLRHSHIAADLTSREPSSVGTA